MPKNPVYISDEDLKEILPGYLKKRFAEILRLEELFKISDYENIRLIAHNLKGTAASYGLEQASEIGSHLEESIKAQDLAQALLQFQKLKHYFENLEIIYI